MSIDSQYEKEHARNLLAQQAELQRLYAEAIDRIYLYASTLQLRNGVFQVSDYPALNAAMERELAVLATRVQALVENGIQRSFDLSQRKFGATINATYYRNATMPQVMQELINRPQARAMEAFIKRVEGRERLGLSQRVFKYTQEQFRTDIEQNLFAGIAEGKSAAEMARDQKAYLRDNMPLFRRVRDAEGKLVLSKAAKAYHPGAGVYRSAYKNALRLTVNETNGAYRKADLERYRTTPFITGFRINLSQGHPKFDQCDVLQGEYPLSFEWTMWHLNCICYMTPIMPTMVEFKEYQQYLLRGEGDKFQFKKVVKEVPEVFNTYVEKNRETFQGWKRLPMWMENNRKFLPVNV